MNLLIPFVLAIVAFSPLQVSAQCDYLQSLIPGETYQVFSPGYSNYYYAGYTCSWLAIAPPGYKVILDCSIIQIPCEDTLVVNEYGNFNDYTDSYICGTGTTIRTSYGNTMSVRLHTVTSYGRFYCTMKAEVDPCACGRHETARIVGGTTSQVNEFPYEALLTDTSANPVCGAALISEFYALTAAHCVISRTTSQTRLVVGEHDRSITTETPFTATYTLASIIYHSDYNSANGNNDVGLVKTNTAILLNKGVGIVCLPWLGDLDSASTAPDAIIAGWGTTEFGGPLSKTLQKAVVSVISNSVCQRTYPQTSSNTFMCTDSNDDKDTCQYDSGTSVFRKKSGRMYSVGVTSAGSGCGGSTPTLNMRVSQYLSWIKEKTTGAKYCSV